jgi:hypothetical protein
MRFVLSALFTFILVASDTGCHSCCCPLFHHRACTEGDCGGGLYDRTCTPGGCGPRYRFHPWSTKDTCVTCDQCGNWTGAPLVSRPTPWQESGYAEDFGQVTGTSDAEMLHEEEYVGAPRAARRLKRRTVREDRVVPGSERVIRRSGRPTLARSTGQPTRAVLPDDSVDDEIPVRATSAKVKRVSQVTR